MKVRISINNKCDLCGLCVQVCPTEVFEIFNNQLIVKEDNCIYCRGCEIVCPEKAITLKPLSLTEIATVYKPLF